MTQKTAQELQEMRGGLVSGETDLDELVAAAQLRIGELKEQILDIRQKRKEVALSDAISASPPLDEFIDKVMDLCKLTDEQVASGFEGVVLQSYDVQYNHQWELKVEATLSEDIWAQISLLPLSTGFQVVEIQDSEAGLFDDFDGILFWLTHEMQQEEANLFGGSEDFPEPAVAVLSYETVFDMLVKIAARVYSRQYV